MDNQQADQNADAARQHVARVCSRFAAAWTSGGDPSIVHFLDADTDADRTELLRALLKIELAFRIKNGDTPNRETYCSLFPHDTELIDEVLLDTQGQASIDETQEWRVGGEGDGGAAQRFGRFEIRNKLGSGGFGAVYRAWDTQLNREVAIKIPQTEGKASEHTDRFLREARASAKLRHANIVPVHDVGQHEQTLFIVSDLIEGQTLRNLIRSKRLSHQEAAALVAKLADALDHAHSAGIVHRDIKPDNIIIDLEGEPHITDFGLARIVSGEELLTQDGALLGTPAYMSPEQSRGDSRSADARSDQWSLGVVLYELLSGKRPFQARGAELFAQIARDDPPPLKQLDASAPEELDLLCRKCLRKDPQQRFASCGELRDELLRWAQQEPLHSKPDRMASRAQGWAFKQPLWTAILSVVVVASLTAACWYALSNPSAPVVEWDRQLQDHLDRVVVKGWDSNLARAIYGDVNTAIDAGQDGRWAIGAGATKDGKAHMIVLNDGEWTAVELQASEAKSMGIEDNSVLRPNLKTRLKQLVLLSEAELELVALEDGRRILRGSVACRTNQRVPIYDLTLIVRSQVHIDGDTFTRQLYHSYPFRELPTGKLNVDVELHRQHQVVAGSDSQLYLQAFVVSERPATFRISNELPCEIRVPADEP